MQIILPILHSFFSFFLFLSEFGILGVILKCYALFFSKNVFLVINQSFLKVRQKRIALRFLTQRSPKTDSV